jgi:hypothetical protein
VHGLTRTSNARNRLALGRWLFAQGGEPPEHSTELADKQHTQRRRCGKDIGVRHPRATYLVIAVTLFCIEVLIATRLSHWGFVRGSLGDVLVTGLVYCVVLAVRDFDRLRLASSVFVFACLVEVAQYLHVAAALGLTKGGALHIAVGDSFDWTDIACYFVGCLASFVIDTRVRPQLRFRG